MNEATLQNGMGEQKGNNLTSYGKNTACKKRRSAAPPQSNRGSNNFVSTKILTDKKIRNAPTESSLVA
jgi:hypothetical protein